MDLYDHIVAKIADTLDFGFVSVQNTFEKSVIIENPSTKNIHFKIKALEIFNVNVKEGTIPRNSRFELKIKITPESAKVVISNMMIVLDDSHSKIIKISAIGKYPNLRISKNALDFGHVLIGNSKEMELVIQNTEKVPATFMIKRKNTEYGTQTRYFHLSHENGEVPAESAFLLKIKYCTFHVSSFSCENFEIIVPGGNVMKFYCTAFCMGLSMEVSSKNVNFDSIEVDNTCAKFIKVFNKNENSTYFNFFFFNSFGPFFFDKVEGVIDAKSSVRVNISFKPKETGTFYERVFCLIKSHMIIAIDLMGSAHDLLNKPKILDQKCIDVFRFKIINGYYSNKIKKLPELNITNFLESMNKSIKKTFKGETVEESSLDETNQLQLHKELFWENTSNTRILHTNTEILDFRFVENGKISEPNIVTIFNTSNEKVKVKWVLNKPAIKNNANDLIKEPTSREMKEKTVSSSSFNMNDVIVISPDETVISRNSSAEFKIYFKPNKPEFYYYAILTCAGTIIENFDKKEEKSNNKNQLFPLPQTKNSVNTQTQSFTSMNHNYLLKTLKSEKKFELFDPPILVKVFAVGHSFPPTTQIFIPIVDVIPKERLIFPPSTINQSMYQTIMIRNKSDTPLYYKFISDITNIFRVYPKCGLINPKCLNLICVEFCPKEVKSYDFPLQIVFNHDSKNMKKITLSGVCVDPFIQIEEGIDTVYFPPTFIGIATRKSVTINNISPIKINVHISQPSLPNANLLIEPFYFDMDANQQKTIDITFCPTDKGEIITKIDMQISRKYDPIEESIGIYNPGSVNLKNIEKFDKRLFQKSLKIIGVGADGNIKIEPNNLEFGTVKVAFHKKMTFSIYNPSNCNFYMKLIFPEDQAYLENIINLDFKEGLINSFCKKDVNVTFKPISRAKIDLKISVYAVENKPEKLGSNQTQNSFDLNKSLKGEITISANGDYPLIKIVDIRNSNIGTAKLWSSFNVDAANKELLQQLTEEEIMFINSEKTNKNIQDFYQKLKSIKFDFGKQLMKKKSKNNFIDIYLTLKNVGGVTSEFFFKFPDDISIKREIWMDPVEPSSNEVQEYHVLKEKLFEVTPRKSKLEPGKCCNIRFRFNIKDKGEHKLRVIFQIVNGKPLIFELYAETHSEKNGILEIRNNILDFSSVPMGYMRSIISPIEIKNVGGIKLSYSIDKSFIREYNNANDDFEVFKIENESGVIGPGDVKYIIGFFRPLTDKLYSVDVPITYHDNIHPPKILSITLCGKGYHPIKEKLPTLKNYYETMPTSRVHNEFEGQIIQKCGVSLEEIDFGILDDKPSVKTLILYNYSNTENCEFEFFNPGFNLKDEISIDPPKGILEPGKHLLIKLKLISNSLSSYTGELEIKINWSTPEGRERDLKETKESKEKVSKEIEREKLFVRVIKRSLIKETSESIERTINPNQSFVESIILDCFREIICDNNVDTLLCERLDNQPLTLYAWTNDSKYPSHKDVRNKLLENYTNLASSSDLNTSSSLAYKRNLLASQQRNNSSQQSNHSKKHKGEAKEGEIELQENFGETEEIKLEDKYMNEMIGKFNYSTQEINEKLLFINEESKNLIYRILENTVYNIISEAVYGETDLSELTKIFFFKR